MLKFIFFRYKENVFLRNDTSINKNFQKQIYACLKRFKRGFILSLLISIVIIIAVVGQFFILQYRIPFCPLFIWAFKQAICKK
jgi:hypothetical protein